VEVDGRRLELPADLAGVMLLNIPSYMGGVDLWAGGDAPAAAGSAAPQSFSDATLEARAASAPSGGPAQSHLWHAAWRVCLFVLFYSGCICL